MLPVVRRLCAADFPLRLSPLSLVHVASGELLLRGDAGAHRLLAGEALALRGEARATLTAARDDTAAFLLEADQAWVERARALSGVWEATETGDALVRETAGTELARRTGQLLLAAHLDRSGRTGAGEALVGIERAGRLLALVALAQTICGSLEAPRRNAGARAYSRRAPLVRLLEELETAPLEGYSLGVLADRLGVSERQASRLLREEIGTSFPDYLASLRIERAKKLLVTTEEPITEVALETGWQSISHFNAVFRRHVGITPTGYRARSLGERELRAAP